MRWRDDCSDPETSEAVASSDRQIAGDCDRHQIVSAMPADTDVPLGSLQIAVTGATGTIGSALVGRLRSRGHAVRRLVRSTAKPETGDVAWNPASGLLAPTALDGCDAIVNLAGEPIAQRWTPERKRAIRDSRVQGTTLLARAIAGMPAKPRVVLSGSAIGFYGDRGDELLDERSTAGTDYLAAVTREWEGAAERMCASGCRVVTMRTGIVLTPQGGALAKLLPPFQLGLGGPIGGGHQWMSWISLDDHVRAMEHALFADTLSGPVNFVAPNPVTNAEFAETLGRVLHRPALIPLPAFALKLMFGEMGEATILSGQRVVPDKLGSAAFEFRHPTLESALKAML